MIFSSLSKREKQIFLAAAIIISSSFFYRFVFEPVLKNWSELDSRIAAKKIKLQRCAKLIAGYQAGSAEYKNYAPAVNGVKSEEQELAEILSQIEEIARKSGVYPNVLKPNSVKDERLYKKFVAEAELDSAMKDLMKFFYQLENSSQMFKIESADINAKPDQKDTVKARLLISKILFKSE